MIVFIRILYRLGKQAKKMSRRLDYTSNSLYIRLGNYFTRKLYETIFTRLRVSTASFETAFLILPTSQD